MASTFWAAEGNCWSCLHFLRNFSDGFLDSLKVLLWGRGAVQGNASLASAVHPAAGFPRAYLSVDVGPAALCL